jgi:cysteinyl-tRNA synthetase
MIDDSQAHHSRLITSFGEGLSRGGSGEWRENRYLVEAAERLEAGMNDDFNTRVALVEVQAVSKRLRSILDSGDPNEESGCHVGWISEFAGEVLGLLPTNERVMDELETLESKRREVASRVEELLEERSGARNSQNWSRADEIRDELASMGVILEDGPEGTTWSI